MPAPLASLPVVGESPDASLPSSVSSAKIGHAVIAAPKPAWQRHGLFRFFSSVKLAVILLAILIVASIAGTLYETTFNADVARAYVYGAPWFNAWLVLLAINLAAAAFSRVPWKRHHTGFLITHLGIIILLAGALVGRLFGIEGTMTLFKGQPPANQLIVQERQLRLQESGAGGSLAWPVNVLGRRPSAGKPWQLGKTPAGWQVELVDYAPALVADFEPTAVPSGGRPAAHVKLFSKRLNRTMEAWLLEGSEEHAKLDLGMAAVQIRRGRAPAPGESQTTAATDANKGTEVDESIFAFAQKAGEQVAQPANGKAGSGAKIRLVVTPAARRVQLDWRGATWEFDVDADRGKDQDLSGSGLFVRIEDYWPEFKMENGRPTSASNEPRDPALLVRVHGRLAPDPDADKAAALNPAVDASAANQALLFLDDSGAITYSLKSSATPQPVTASLTPKQEINTGWADWQLSVDAVLPQAAEYTAFRPVANSGKPANALSAGNHTEGVRVRMSRPGAPPVEEWVPAGWQVTLPTGPQPALLSYGWRRESLPIGLQLTEFEVERNEGNDQPAGFKSTLRVMDAHGNTDTGSCWMNNPHNFPGRWWNTFSGLTYKISQASWNPDNLNESTVQILRDPGWLLKWIGSLLVCLGIYTLFYLRPHPAFLPQKAKAPGAKPAPKTKVKKS